MAKHKIEPVKPKKGDTVENLLGRLLILDESFDAIIEHLANCDRGGSGDYGYLGDLKDEIKALEAVVFNYPDDPPKIESAMDQLKFEFFVDNFSKIPLDALEWIVKTVDENKIPV